MKEETTAEILSLTQKLPDDFLNMCSGLSVWDHYLFTWRNVEGRKTAYCTKCKKEIDIDLRGKRTITPKMRLLSVTRHNNCCECPACGAWVQYKDRNRGRGNTWQENYLYYYQPLSDGGVVLRTFYLHISYAETLSPSIAYSEHQRVYFTGGKVYRFCRRPANYNPYFRYYDWFNADVAESNYIWEPIKTLHTPVPWAGRMYGCFKGYVDVVYEKGAFSNDFKYSCIEMFLNEGKDVSYRDAAHYKAVEYLALYQKNPSLIEKFMKQGLKELLLFHFQQQNMRFMINFNKPDVYGATGLTKPSVRALADKGGFETARSLLQYKLLENYKLTPKNAEYICRHDVSSVYHLRVWIARVKTKSADEINRQIKYFRKQKITRFYDYNDYLRQLNDLKMPLTDENLYPRDFKAAHEALSVEINRRANAKKKAAAAREEKRFRKKYTGLLETLYFEDETFVIRPAKGNAELLEESNVLSHCVYSCYRDKYKKLQTVICLIRKKAEPEKPFYTLEIKPDYSRIVQCRGKSNCGVTPEVEAFKNKWFDWLQINLSKEKKLCRKTA